MSTSEPFPNQGPQGEPSRDPRFVVDPSNSQEADRISQEAYAVALRMHAPEVILAVTKTAISQKQHALTRFEQASPDNPNAPPGLRSQEHADQLRLIYGYWQDGLHSQLLAHKSVAELAQRLSALRSDPLHDLLPDLGDSEERQRMSERTLRIDNCLLSVVEQPDDIASDRSLYGTSEQVSPEAYELAAEYNSQLTTIAATMSGKQALAAMRIAHVSEVHKQFKEVNLRSVEFKTEYALLRGLVRVYTAESETATRIHLQLTQFSFVRLIEAMKDVTTGANNAAYWHAQDAEMAGVFGITL